MQTVTFLLRFLMMRAAWTPAMLMGNRSARKLANSPVFISMQENIFCDYVVTNFEDSKHVTNSD